MIARALMLAAAIAVACAQPASGDGKDTPMNGDPGPGAGGAAASLALSATLTGTQLHLALANHSRGELVVLSHVTAGQRTDLDWFTVTVTVGGAARLLRFSGPRDHAGRVKQTLAPGASLRQDVDLAWWAKQPANGGAPLPTGTGTLVAAYQVTGEAGVWNGRIESPAIAVHW